MRRGVRTSPDSEAETLGFVRAAVFAMWLVEVVPDPLSFWAELPRSMHQPVGVLRLVPEERWEQALDPEVLDWIKRVLVVLLVLSAAGARPYRPTAGATAAMLTGHQALLRGFTFVNHEELAMLISAYVLALFPAGDGFAVGSWRAGSWRAGSWRARRARRARPETYAGALDAMSFLLVIPYCGIAARRLTWSGPKMFLGDSLPHWLGSLDQLDPERLGIGPWLLGRPTLVRFLKAGFLVTTVFELLGPLSLIAPRLRRAWVAAIVTLHLVNRFTLKLFFWQNTVLILLLFAGAGAGSARLATRWGGRRGRRRSLAHRGMCMALRWAS